MSPHHSDQMSQRSQVSRVALWRCSLNVFVFFIVFVFVFVFVFLLVRSCPLITVIKCLKGQKSLGLLFVCQSVKYRELVSQWVTRSPIELFWTAKNQNVYIYVLCQEKFLHPSVAWHTKIILAPWEYLSTYQFTYGGAQPSLTHIPYLWSCQQQQQSPNISLPSPLPSPPPLAFRICPTDIW